MFIKKILQDKVWSFSYATITNSAANFFLTFILSRYYKDIDLLLIFSIALYFVQLFNSLCIKTFLYSNKILKINLFIFIIIITTYSIITTNYLLILFTICLILKDLIRYSEKYKFIKVYCFTFMLIILLGFNIIENPNNFILLYLLIIFLVWFSSTLYLNYKKVIFKDKIIYGGRYDFNLKIVISDLLPMIISLFALNAIVEWSSSEFLQYREYLALYGAAGLLVNISEYKILSNLKNNSAYFIDFLFLAVLIIFTIIFNKFELIFYYYALCMWFSFLLSKHILISKYKVYDSNNINYYLRVIILVISAFILFPILKTEFFYLFFPLINLIELAVYKFEYK